MRKVSREITLASRAELTNEHYYLRLWLATVNLDLSRRKLGEKIELTIYGFPGQFYAPNGMPIPVPNLEHIFPDDDFRHLGNYLQRDRLGIGPKRRCIRAIGPLQMLSAMFQIAEPETARTFNRRHPHEIR